MIIKVWGCARIYSLILLIFLVFFLNFSKFSFFVRNFDSEAEIWKLLIFVIKYQAFPPSKRHHVFFHAVLLSLPYVHTQCNFSYETNKMHFIEWLQRIHTLRFINFSSNELKSTTHKKLRFDFIVLLYYVRNVLKMYIYIGKVEK